jgi:hypothetical protein
VETAEGRTPNFQGGTKESYSEINLMLKTLLRATTKLYLLSYTGSFGLGQFWTSMFLVGCLEIRGRHHAICQSRDDQVGCFTFHSLWHVG